MKLLKLITIGCATFFITAQLRAQNVSLNILTQNSGEVHTGGSILLQVDVCNTDPARYVKAFKLKPQISVPAATMNISGPGNTLPPGWTIINNNDSVINLCNGTDSISPNACRTIYILLKAKSLAGLATIAGQLSFSNGNSPGSEPGASTRYDTEVDNFSTSTCKIIK